MPEFKRHTKLTPHAFEYMCALGQPEVSALGDRLVLALAKVWDANASTPPSQDKHFVTIGQSDDKKLYSFTFTHGDQRDTGTNRSPLTLIRNLCRRIEEHYAELEQEEEEEEEEAPDF